jgi:hypothetical protein
MSTTPHTRPSAPSTRPAATELGGALAFVACYLAVDLVAGDSALTGGTAAEWFDVIVHERLLTPARPA